MKELRESTSKLTYRQEVDALITSNYFLQSFSKHVEGIAMYKHANGRRYRRSLDYAATGVLDLNDLIQEGYLCFLEAYDKVDWGRINESNNPDAELWAYLKKSTTLSFERQLRFKKDGVRIPERAHFKTKMNNINMITSLFSQIDNIFFTNQEDVATSKWETDLIGAFFDVHLDDYLDLTFKGERNLKGIERTVIKEFYGLEGLRKTSKELGVHFNVSVSTIDVVRKRAIDKLKVDKSKYAIAKFLCEYKIKTNADYNLYI